jgi:hypothetical protein
MKVKLFGEKQDTQELLNKVQHCLDELGLVDFIEVEESTDETLRTKLNIMKVPALIIEEQSIDFQDMIFE